MRTAPSQNCRLPFFHFDDVESGARLTGLCQREARPRKRWLLLSSTVIFCLIALALGLGLGLRCASKYSAWSSESYPPQSSKHYEIPEHLERISID